MKKIGFIGTGIMGIEMIRNLKKAGYDVSIFTRTKTKAEPLISEGFVWENSIDKLSKGKDVIITMLGYPSDVEEVYFKGILNNADANTYLIDMTTSSPSLAQKIYNESKNKNMHSLDAPVSGGQIGAQNATLSIMVGGDEADFNACHYVFEAMGKTIAYIGEAGAGQVAKAANQTAIAGCIAGVAEAISLVKGSGLDPKKVLDVISKGAARSFQMEYNGYMMLKEDMSPSFYMKHYIKDLKIAASTSKSNSQELPILEAVLQIYEELAAKGMNELGTQAIIKKYSEE